MAPGPGTGTRERQGTRNVRGKWPYTTSTWKRLRLAKLAVDPLCAFHAARGEVVAAEVVDHNVPVRQGGDPFPALDGLTSLCAACHNEKTARMDQGAGAVTGRRFRGCDEAGNPLDRADGWWS